MIIFSLLGLCCVVAAVAWLIPLPLRTSSVILPPPPPVPLESLFPRDTLNDYQERAMFFHVTAPSNLVSYSLGLCGESGEVAEMIKKHLAHGQDVDIEKLKLELGDVLWYVSAMATLYELTLDEIANGNLQKLAKRYPSGFRKGGGNR